MSVIDFSFSASTSNYRIVHWVTSSVSFVNWSEIRPQCAVEDNLNVNLVHVQIKYCNPLVDCGVSFFLCSLNKKCLWLCLRWFLFHASWAFQIVQEIEQFVPGANNNITRSQDLETQICWSFLSPSRTARKFTRSTCQELIHQILAETLLTVSLLDFRSQIYEIFKRFETREHIDTLA